MAASFIARTGVTRPDLHRGTAPGPLGGWHPEVVPAEDDRRLAQMLGAMMLLGILLWALLGWGAWLLIAALAS